MPGYLLLSEEQETELQNLAEQLITPCKGVFYFHENIAIIGKRLEAMGAEDTEDYRNQYWKLFLTAGSQSTGEIGEFISGMFLSDDLLKHELDGTLVPEFLAKDDILSGTQFDKGYMLLMGSDEECTTQGLDNFGQRCEDFKEKGVKFLNWKCLIKLTEYLPSPLAILENANTLARFASECQKNTMLPVLHVELHHCDQTQSLEFCQTVLEQVLASIYKAMNDHNVFLEGSLLMASILTKGHDNTQVCEPSHMAIATLTAFLRTVPPSVPGILLLSGALHEEDASVVLDTMNKLDARKPCMETINKQDTRKQPPWILTFAFDRAMEGCALKTWAGQHKFYDQAQTEFINRIKINSKASVGKYIEIPEVPEVKPPEHKGKKKK